MTNISNEKGVNFLAIYASGVGLFTALVAFVLFQLCSKKSSSFIQLGCMAVAVLGLLENATFLGANLSFVFTDLGEFELSSLRTTVTIAIGLRAAKVAAGTALVTALTCGLGRKEISVSDKLSVFVLTCVKYGATTFIVVDDLESPSTFCTLLIVLADTGFLYWISINLLTLRTTCDGESLDAEAIYNRKLTTTVIIGALLAVAVIAFEAVELVSTGEEVGIMTPFVVQMSTMAWTIWYFSLAFLCSAVLGDVPPQQQATGTLREPLLTKAATGDFVPEIV